MAARGLRLCRFRRLSRPLLARPVDRPSAARAHCRRPSLRRALDRLPVAAGLAAPAAARGSARAPRHDEWNRSPPGDGARRPAGAGGERPGHGGAMARPSRARIGAGEELARRIAASAPCLARSLCDPRFGVARGDRFLFYRRRRAAAPGHGRLRLERRHLSAALSRRRLGDAARLHRPRADPLARHSSRRTGAGRNRGRSRAGRERARRAGDGFIEHRPPPVRRPRRAGEGRPRAHRGSRHRAALSRHRQRHIDRTRAARGQRAVGLQGGARPSADHRPHQRSADRRSGRDFPQLPGRGRLRRHFRGSALRASAAYGGRRRTGPSPARIAAGFFAAVAAGADARGNRSNHARPDRASLGRRHHDFDAGRARRRRQ